MRAARKFFVALGFAATLLLPLAAYAGTTTNTPPNEISASDQITAAEQLAAQVHRAGPDQHASFSVTFNGNPEDDTVVVLREHDVLVLESYLKALHQDSTAENVETIGDDKYVSLSSRAPEVTYEVDADQFTLHLHSDVRLLPRTLRSFKEGELTQQAPSAERSAFANYSITANTPQFSAQGSFEGGLTLSHGLVMSSASITSGSFKRGLTNYMADNQPRLTRITVGDDLADNEGLGGATIVGGIGYGRSYDLEPSVIRSPTAGISGVALAPARADIYVNGAFFRSVDVPPGPFNFSDVAVPAGGGVTRVVLHDQSGGTQTFSSGYYAASQALLKGASDYSYNLGFARNNPYAMNDVYSALTTLDRYRIGLSDRLTAGASLEASHGLTNDGVNADVRTAFGEFNAEHHFSSSLGHPGHASSFGYSFGNQLFSAGANFTVRSNMYATTSLPTIDDRRVIESSQSVSMPLVAHAALTIEHTKIDYRDTAPDDEITATAAVPLKHSAVLSIIGQRLRGAHPQINISALLTIATGRETTLSASTQQTGGATSTTLSLQKTPTPDSRFGYSEQATIGQTNSNFATATYRSQHGDATVDFNSSPGSTSTSFNIAGGIVAFKSGIYFTRSLQGAYDLVTVAGGPRSEVYVENRPIGLTDRRGSMVITDLTPYTENLITISAADAPLNAVIDNPEQTIVPRGRVGVITAFNMRKLQLFTGSVSLLGGTAGQRAATGRLTLVGGGQTFVSDVGRAGEFYFENLQTRTYRAILTSEDKPCVFDVHVPASREFVVKMGTVSCRPPIAQLQHGPMP